MTNAERIRNMTDEELAREINKIDRRICDTVENCENDINCYACRLKWMKQDVKKNET